MNNEIAFDIDSNFYSLGAVLGTADDAKFDSDKFNSMFDGNHDKDLKIFHLNMCSFPRNVNTLLGYLSTIKQQFDIICLTETWLNEGRFIENYFSDYNKFYSKRPANQSLGGGCAIFIKRTFYCTELSHLSCNLDHIECIFVELTYLTKKLTIGCCYRKPVPNNASNFIEDISFRIS